MPYPYYEVNKIIENGIINIFKLPVRDGFERRALMLNKKPMSITSPKFDYRCYSISERQEVANTIKEFMSKIPSDDKSQSANDLRGCVEEMEENGFFEIKQDKFNVIFNVNQNDSEYCDFVDNMETLSQSIKKKFDKYFQCENEILETIDSSYYQRKFKFSSLFHKVEEGSNLTVAYFKKDGKKVQIDADMENFYKETKGELVQVRFVFNPIIYAKHGKYYLRNEVIGIQFSNKKKNHFLDDEEAIRFSNFLDEDED